MSVQRSTNILPGFRLATGYAITYLGLLVLLPLAAVVAKATSGGLAGLWASMTGERALAAYRLSMLGALGAAAINTVFGVIIAWVIARYRFPGRRIVDALIDLPLALPTAVAGIALTAVYSRDAWLGAALERVGITVAYTNLGNCLYKMKQPEKAVEAWRRALELDPMNENARRGLRMFQQDPANN